MSIYSIAVSLLVVMKAQAKNNTSVPEGELSLGTLKVANCPDWTLLHVSEAPPGSVVMLMRSFR